MGAGVSGASVGAGESGDSVVAAESGAGVTGASVGAAVTGASVGAAVTGALVDLGDLDDLGALEDFDFVRRRRNNGSLRSTGFISSSSCFSSATNKRCKYRSLSSSPSTKTDSTASTPENDP